MRAIVLVCGAAIMVCAFWAAWGANKNKATNPTSQPSPDLARIAQVMQALEPLQQPLGKPREGEWLYTHKEPGQSYKEYIGSEPVIPTSQRRTIYIQPIGEFTAKQRKVVTLAAEYISACYGLPVKIEKDILLDVIPDSARRTHPTWGGKQILSTYVMDKVLAPRLPKDAFAMIAFTSSDLWPGEGWNFVFGQASLRDRVGVWSIHRFGDPDKNDDQFRDCLRRTVATGVHELGHMFSMEHCIYNECVMCGSNSLPEADCRPLSFCPVCMGKMLWATGTRAEEHLSKLAEFCHKQGLGDDAKAFNKALAAVQGATSKPTSAPAVKP